MTWRNSLLRPFFEVSCIILLGGCNNFPSPVAQNPSKDTIYIPSAFSNEFNFIEERDARRNELFSLLRPLVYRIEVSIPLLYRTERYQGTGWGWAKRYIWTCKHLLPAEKNLRVEVWDMEGSCHEAKVVWRDSIADVALLRIDTICDFPSVSLHSGSFPKVGESVFTVGAPLGLLGTFQEGFVAAEPRLMNVGKNYSQVLLQLSIPAQVGSSGSPVVDKQGRVIGMISDIATISGGYEGISFAIPAQVLSQVWEAYCNFASNDSERACKSR